MNFMMHVHSVEKSELFLFSFLWDKRDVRRWRDVHELVRFVERLFNDHNVRHTITFTSNNKTFIRHLFIISFSLFNPYFKNVPFLPSLLNTCGMKSIVPLYLFSALLVLKFPPTGRCTCIFLFILHKFDHIILIDL